MGEWLVGFLVGVLIVVGFVAVLAGLLWLLYFFSGKLIKLLGYWPLFIKALRKVAEERDRKI